MRHCLALLALPLLLAACATAPRVPTVTAVDREPDEYEGGELVATVTGATELTGDSDYTISLWAKTFATPVENGYPTLAAIGSQQIDHSLCSSVS